MVQSIDACILAKCHLHDLALGVLCKGQHSHTGIVDRYNMPQQLPRGPSPSGMRIADILGVSVPARSCSSFPWYSFEDDIIS